MGLGGFHPAHHGSRLDLKRQQAGWTVVRGVCGLWYLRGTFFRWRMDSHRSPRFVAQMWTIIASAAIEPDNRECYILLQLG
jgi:hypothetical protein